MSKKYSISNMYYEMMRRCYNPKSIAYNSYGAKGIKVCDEWQNRDKFKEWCVNNNWNSELRLARKDGSKDYAPDNCYFTDYFRPRKEMIKKRNTRNERKEILSELGAEHITEQHLYKIFQGIKKRCYNKSHEHYKDYGGRGIKICDEWMGKNGGFKFCLWAVKNGYKEGLSIDRIDVNGDYTPDNCRWADRYLQANNRRNSVKIEYYGQPITISQLSRITGISYGKLYLRIVKKNINVYDVLKELKKIS